CFPFPSNPRAAHRSPPAPVMPSDRPPTFFLGLCAQKTVRLSSPLFRRMPRPGSCPEALLPFALRPVAFSFADKRVGSGPVAPAFCHSDAGISARLARRPRPWLRCFWKPTDRPRKLSRDFHFERILRSPREPQIQSKL